MLYIVLQAEVCAGPRIVWLNAFLHQNREKVPPQIDFVRQSSVCLIVALPDAWYFCGAGSFGIVQKAERINDGKVFAIKCLWREYTTWQECLQLREVWMRVRRRDTQIKCHADCHAMPGWGQRTVRHEMWSV